MRIEIAPTEVSMDSSFPIELIPPVQKDTFDDSFVLTASHATGRFGAGSDPDKAKFSTLSSNSMVSREVSLMLMTPCPIKRRNQPESINMTWADPSAFKSVGH